MTTRKEFFNATAGQTIPHVHIPLISRYENDSEVMRSGSVMGDREK